MQDLAKKLELCQEILDSVVSQLTSVPPYNWQAGLAEDDNEKSAQGAD